MRLSVTWLDQYLYWRESEDMSVEELMERLRGEKVPTVQMRAGIAFHKLLENAEEGELHGVSVDGFRFHFDIDADLPLAPVRELKGEHVIETHWGPVTLSGQVDGIDGHLVRDYKLTGRFDAERYADSYQWRAYLLMFGARAFVYDVFTGKVDDDHVVVYGYDRLPLYAYPNMERDVTRVAGELAEIVARCWPERIAA